jgi:hypothetical protein
MSGGDAGYAPVTDDHLEGDGHNNANPGQGAAYIEAVLKGGGQSDD